MIHYRAFELTKYWIIFEKSVCQFYFVFIQKVAAVIGKELTNLPPSEWKDRSSHFSSSLQALQHLAQLQQMPRMGQLFPAHLEYGLPFPSSWAIDLEPELENISTFNRQMALTS